MIGNGCKWSQMIGIGHVTSVACGAITWLSANSAKMRKYANREPWGSSTFRVAGISLLTNLSRNNWEMVTGSWLKHLLWIPLLPLYMSELGDSALIWYRWPSGQAWLWPCKFYCSNYSALAWISPHTLSCKGWSIENYGGQIKPRHCPNLEACYLGRYSLYRGFQRVNCLSWRNFGLDIQNEQEFSTPHGGFKWTGGNRVAFDSFSSVSWVEAMNNFTI